MILKFLWGSFPFQPAGRGKEDGKPALENLMDQDWKKYYITSSSPWLELRRRTNKTVVKGNLSICSAMWGDGLPCNSYLFIYFH